MAHPTDTLPLAGLRVLEVATGVAGPYAGRLLALLGAEVVKLEPAGGDVTRTMPIDDEPLRSEPGPLFVALNAGKKLERSDDPSPFLDGVHVVIDSEVRRARAGTPLDPSSLEARGIVAVTVTAWGADADDAGRPEDELLVQAASGILTALTEAPHDPTRFPGWQSQYLAGAFAAAGALTALSGEGRHVDVSWVGAVAAGVEGELCALLHAVDQPKPPPAPDGRDRQKGFQVGAFPAGAFRCNDGFVVPGTVRPVDWELQCDVYGRPDLLADERFSARMRFTNRDELRAELQPWYDAHTKREIFAAALDAGWAAAMVMTAADALEDEHLAARSFLTGDGLPAHLALPWQRGERSDGDVGGSAPAPPPLDSLKVLELTWAWAGPFVGRHLGAYGADVVRIEAGRYPDGWRTRLRWRDAGVPVPEGEDPDGFTWDAAALHNSLNRNKRSLSLDLTQADGRALFVRLLEQADLLVLNMSYRMLADRGIEDEVEAAVRDRGLVVLNMPALGATGPYRDMPGYGILMEGMGGMAARYGDRSEGARTTSTYYPDLVAGIHGTVAALAALAHRRATGKGVRIDVSQQETMWLQLAEGLALRTAEGREPGRLGNAEPRRAPSGLYPTDDRRWVAIRVDDDEAYEALAALAGLPAGQSLEERLADRDGLDEALSAWTRKQSQADALVALQSAGVACAAGASQRQAYAEGWLEQRGLIERVQHPLTGDRPALAMPLRIDGRPWRTRRPAARFAEHTDEVLADWLALPDDDRARLRAAGVIGTRPGDARR